MDEQLPLRDQMLKWRQEVMSNTISDEELARAVQVIRAGRVSASIASSKSKAAKAPIDSNKLLEDF